MTLGKQLVEIARSRGDEKRRLVHEFEQAIEGHEEEYLLHVCLREAIEGKDSVWLREKVIPPLTLKEEGFYLKNKNEYAWR